MNLAGRDFLKLLDYSSEEIEYLIDLAAELKEKKKNKIPHEVLKGRNIALIFEKTSTRTRCSFEVAANTNGVDFALVTRGVSLLAELAGADGMIGGQIIDLAIENQPPEIDVVLNMYAKKTGALLVAAAKIGTLIAGGNEVLQSAAEKYALNLGIAFQIQDDVLDIVGDAALLGKPVGSDEKNSKSTYVSFKGLEQAKKDVEHYTNMAKLSLEPFGEAANDLIALADYLIDRQY